MNSEETSPGDESKDQQIVEAVPNQVIFNFPSLPLTLDHIPAAALEPREKSTHLFTYSTFLTDRENDGRLGEWSLEV